MEEQTYGNGAGGVMAIMGSFMIFFLAFAVVMIIAFWKIFTKAGKPGWAAIIPIYSGIVLLEIVGKPIWWIILFIIPIVNIVIAIMGNSSSLCFFWKGRWNDNTSVNTSYYRVSHFGFRRR